MYKYKMSLKDKLKVFSANSFIIVLSLAVALIPAWIYVLLKFVFSPHGFWQNVFLLGVSLYFLGVIQVVFLVLWLVFIFGFLAA